ncbi:FUN14 domain-containing protein 1 isoform 2 [Scophthalmus maximus]|uniref:FUN14 domain-containing protein 2 n=1 Tax=Scophthalmus maximus TaxID=52904 RepID=A0A2U9CFG5_SCOMX|nr:FUN14 domain-containing protein 1 isoform 2 [Scophthalmus maximus]
MANIDKVEEEIYDKVVDLTEYAKRQRWWNRLFGKNSGPVAEKYSVATQIAIGGVSGWCVGYLFQKVGKVAATSVGGGLLLLQVSFNLLAIHSNLHSNPFNRKENVFLTLPLIHFFFLDC